ncbi:acyl carrier protein [Aeromicrobium sp.]|uniref:acyl carrier protein n=1 Tax=Aeromicrobium sp. TaxID=1871063 RepID=UPI00199BE39F|nr:acyl carrier protein [Aeromicrobium sp.]MBC7630051.1 acyl carrier protein [Aeromicrobium sp.]
MPAAASVRQELTDILVRVVGCPADDVVPEARLKDLGTDSLTIVEVGEELGRRFGVYLSDDTIDGLVTVDDAIKAVVRHDGSVPPRGATSVGAPSTRTPPSALANRSATAAQRKNNGAVAQLVLALAIVGGIVGATLGLGGAALVTATGLGSVDLPPVSAPSTPATASATPSATPTPPPTTSTSGTVDPDPTLTVSSENVSPGERFVLQGAFPALGENALLQVQVKDPGGEWDEFPIDTTTRAGGQYKTEIYTSRTGKRKFRMLAKESGKVSPAATVTIG